MRNASKVWPLWLALVGLTVHLAAQTPKRSSAQAAASTLRQVAYVKASNPGEDDKFGDIVALSGDGNTLAVGAPLESSAAKGINGKGANDPGLCSGAALVAGSSCDDGNACTTSDACTDTGSCVGSPMLPGTPCDDSNQCTADARSADCLCLDSVARLQYSCVHRFA